MDGTKLGDKDLVPGLVVVSPLMRSCEIKMKYILQAITNLLHATFLTIFTISPSKLRRDQEYIFLFLIINS
jgi:hypothetical protein